MLGLINQKLMRLYSVCAYVSVWVCLRQTDWMAGWFFYYSLSEWLAPACPSYSLPACFALFLHELLTDWPSRRFFWLASPSPVCHFVCSWTKLKWFPLVFKPKRKLIPAVYIFCHYHLCNDHFFPIGTSICCHRVQSVMSGECTQLIIVRLMVIFCFHFEHIRKRMKRAVLSSERHSDTTGSSLVLQSNLPSS